MSIHQESSRASLTDNPPEKVCPRCGHRFRAKRKDAKVCSSRCRQALYWKRHHPPKSKEQWKASLRAAAYRRMHREFYAGYEAYLQEQAEYAEWRASLRAQTVAVGGEVAWS